MSNSVRQPIMTINLHKEDGDRQIKVFKKGGILLLILIVLGALHLFNYMLEELAAYERQAELDELKPTMMELANLGQEEAAQWLVKNFFKEENYRIQEYVTKGQPWAIYLQGRMTIKKGNVEEGEALIAQAAEKGFAPAVAYLTK
ncbi:hypothetical protein [Microbulbifer discodermiae]|uniref:hypothetical protein n=1 Tax=Microbulbifer sp. 2201CG32-9 TaxID=3232309 RepID=UPI00345B73C0